MTLPRLSLRVFALLVSGFSLGLIRARADEFPEDPNTIETLTVEQARKPARPHHALRRSCPRHSRGTMESGSSKASTAVAATARAAWFRGN